MRCSKKIRINLLSDTGILIPIFSFDRSHQISRTFEEGTFEEETFEENLDETLCESRICK